MSMFNKKAASLIGILEEAHALGKKASQQIKHLDPVTGQNSLGVEMQKQQHNAVDGISADDPDQVPAPQTAPRQIPGGIQEPLSQTSNEAIGAVTTMPQNSKTAALRRKVASLIRNISVSQAADETPSGIGVMRKFAAYVQTADERLLAGIHRDMQTLAHTNPLFNQACEAVAMRKFAAEAEALADDQGISPEDAGAVLQASIANDPEAAQEFQGEVEGEAVGDLADAEAGALSEQNDLNEAAARASASTGEDVTPDDIEEAIATVEEAAAAQGVDPIDLISAAADQLQNSEDGGEDPEADALAEQLVQQASDEGISPEELIAGLSDDVTDDGSGCDDGSCEDDEDAEQAVKKEACLHNLAGTRRGQNVASLLANM